MEDALDVGCRFTVAVDDLGPGLWPALRKVVIPFCPGGAGGAAAGVQQCRGGA